MVNQVDFSNHGLRIDKVKRGLLEMDEEWFNRARGAGIIGSLLLIACMLLLLAVPCLEPIRVQGKGDVLIETGPNPLQKQEKEHTPAAPYGQEPIEGKGLVCPPGSSPAQNPPQREADAQPAPKPPFEEIILEAAQRYGVDPALIRAMIMAESGYNPKAVSKKGAQGLMQLMPSTAKELGISEPLDPVHNIHGGVKYFRRLLDRFDGDVKLALAAYNAGSTKVRRYKGIPPIRATRYYINKVFRYYKIYKGQMKPSTDDA